MRRSEQQINVIDLVQAMERLGAEFYFSHAGTLFVRDLDLLPGYLRDEFYQCQEKSLVHYLKSRQLQDGKSSLPAIV